VWAGAALYKSLDGEASYQRQDLGLMRAWTGWVGTATPAADWHVLDEETVITVLLDAGELMSVADIALYNGANLVSLGQEILAFGLAELTAPMTYKLSRLLRGRRGTEWAVATHTPGERLVVLDAAVRTVAMTFGERGVPRPMKTVTIGQGIDAVASTTFTPTAANLIPWSVAPRPAMQDGADFILSWYMRSRFNGSDDFAPIGFDADFSHFEIAIFTDNTYTTIVRTVVTDGGSPTNANTVKMWTYDETNQTLDFGSPQSVLYYQIAQVSATDVSHPENLVAA
jgi:hypothetical protein